VAKAQPFGSTPSEQTIAALVVSWRRHGLNVPAIVGLLRCERHVHPRTGLPIGPSEVRSVLARHRAQSRSRALEI
jgi:hypothetical protein